MEEQLKLKIIDLISAELNDEESQEIFSLMENNKEAKEFYEHTKITFNLLNAEMNSAQWDASEKRLENLIEELDKKESSLWSLFPPNLSIKSLGGILSINNGLVAAFTFAFAIFISPSLINQKIQLNEFSFYEEEIFISSTRGDDSEELPLAIKKIYIQNLINSGNTSGFFKFEEELILKITIDDAFKHDGKEFYFGIIEKGQDTQNFSVIRGEKEIINFSP